MLVLCLLGRCALTNLAALFSVFLVSLSCWLSCSSFCRSSCSLYESSCCSEMNNDGGSLRSENFAFNAERLFLVTCITLRMLSNSFWMKQESWICMSYDILAACTPSRIAQTTSTCRSAHDIIEKRSWVQSCAHCTGYRAQEIVC